MIPDESILPPGWRLVALADVVDRLQYGYTASAQSEASGTRFLRITDLSDEGVDWQNVPGCSISRSDFERYRLADGDVVFARTGSLEKAWLVESAPEAVFASYLVRGRPLRPAWGAWLKYFVRSSGFREQIGATGAGIGRSNVNARKLGTVRFPLPPEGEIVRITARLEKLQARSRGTRKALESILPMLERFRQSVLAAAFRGTLTADWRALNSDAEPTSVLVDRTPIPGQPRGGKAPTDMLIPGVGGLSVNDPGTPLPDGWKWVSLLRIARQETGHTPSRGEAEYWNGDIPWIGIKDAGHHHGEYIHDTHQHVTQLGVDNSSARLLPAGTVCLSRTASVGYVTIMGRNMATSQDFATWTCTDALDPEYLMYALLSEGEEIRRFGKGSTHTTIYFPEIRALHIALAPSEEQKEIVRQIRRALAVIDPKSDFLREVVAQLDTLDQSVIAKAFRGELAPQDPSDEPPSVLLERAHEARRPTKRTRSLSRKRAVSPASAEALSKSVETDLALMLRSIGGRVSPERLWKVSGLPIEEFYNALKKSVESNKVRETRSQDGRELEVKNAY